MILSLWLIKGSLLKCKREFIATLIGVKRKMIGVCERRFCFFGVLMVTPKASYPYLINLKQNFSPPSQIAVIVHETKKTWKAFFNGKRLLKVVVAENETIPNVLTLADFDHLLEYLVMVDAETILNGIDHPKVKETNTILQI